MSNVETDRKTLLLLAASDMEQVIEAAKAIQREQQAGEENVQLVRALETALAVCYWRPFSEINKMGHLTDADALDPKLHADLKALRNRSYAHFDKRSGRVADVHEVVTEAGKAHLVSGESWWSLPDEWLPRVIEVATRQRDAFRAEGIALLSGSSEQPPL